MARGWCVGGKQDKGGWCHVTGRRGSVTLSVSQGDGCTLLGPAAPPALSEEPAAPDTDTHSHTDRPNMTCRRSHRRQGLMAQAYREMEGLEEIYIESLPPELDEWNSALSGMEKSQKSYCQGSTCCHSRR